ncbi:hypothetical protein HDV62DRAFT_257391 [Trichoderma sp. SZMC 28011]
MLIDLLLYYLFTSLGRLFAISYQILSIASPMHALPTFFFFLLGRKTDTARRRRTAATDVFITIVSFSLSLLPALALSVAEVHIRRDGITDYFPSSLLLLARGSQGVALPSITFFFLSSFLMSWIFMRNRRCGIFFFFG